MRYWEGKDQPLVKHNVNKIIVRALFAWTFIASMLVISLIVSCGQGRLH